MRPVRATSGLGGPARSPHAPARRTDRLVLLAVASMGILTLLAVFAGNGELGLAIAPLALTLVAVAMARAPLRDSLLVLAFLGLTLETPSEVPAAGMWKSPLYTIGALLLNHINVTVPIKALAFSGLDVVLVFLAIVFVVRRLLGSQIDVRENVPAAAPILRAAVLCIATVLVLWAYGMSRSDADWRFSLWQVYRFAYLPLVLLLSCAAIRGPADARAFGIGLLCAAVVRALLAAYIRHLVPSAEEMPYATTHADSMLFADAVLLVLVALYERRSRRNVLVAVATLPVLAWGMVANNRRLVWGELLIALCVLFLVLPASRTKRAIVRAVIVALPIIAIYVGVGWNRSSAIFQPVHSIRSMTDSTNDKSTRWRDLENYDLYYTLRENPVLGTGFGHGYTEIIKLPDISRAFEMYRFSPHNAILGLFAFAGVLGFAGIWMMIPLGVFFAVRSYRFAATARDRVTALVGLGILVVFVIHSYGDIGLGSPTALFTVAPTLALLAKQAVATGGWLTPASERPPSEDRELR